MARPKAEATTEMPGIPRDEQGIIVQQASLHAPITAGGVFNTEKTLHKSKLPGVKMWLIPQGLLVTCKGATVIVPHANVACAVIDDGKKENT